MKKEDIPFLWQLVKTLEDAELKLEDSYNKKDYKNFEMVKNYMIKIQNKINEITE